MSVDSSTTQVAVCYAFQDLSDQLYADDVGALSCLTACFHRLQWQIPSMPRPSPPWYSFCFYKFATILNLPHCDPITSLPLEPWPPWHSMLGIPLSPLCPLAQTSDLMPNRPSGSNAFPFHPPRVYPTSILLYHLFDPAHRRINQPAPLNLLSMHHLPPLQDE
eukprot:Gb_07450 [translate_table: standard]